MVQAGFVIPLLSTENFESAVKGRTDRLFMKEELIEMAGVVVDKQPNAYFKVQINDTDHMVLATISGRMRRNRIRILMGDRVDIELSPYDLTKGRITYRHK